MPIVLLLLALAAALLLTRTRPATPTPGTLVRWDEAGVQATYAGGDVRRIAWDEISTLGITTTDEGPFCEDVFWGLHDAQGPRIVYGSGDDGAQALLAELQRRLPGLDNRQLVEAMGSTQPAHFTLWRR